MMSTVSAQCERSRCVASSSAGADHANLTRGDSPSQMADLRCISQFSADDQTISGAAGVVQAGVSCLQHCLLVRY
jgi:hypothetical protein